MTEPPELNSRTDGTDPSPKLPTSLPDVPGPSAKADPAKPRIQDSPGDTPRSARAAGEVLAATGTYFTSGGALVRVIDRDENGVSVEQVHEQTLKLVLADMIDWEVRGRDGVAVRINPPHGNLLSKKVKNNDDSHNDKYSSRHSAER